MTISKQLVAAPADGPRPVVSGDPCISSLDLEQDAGMLPLAVVDLGVAAPHLGKAPNGNTQQASCTRPDEHEASQAPSIADGLSLASHVAAAVDSSAECSTPAGMDTRSCSSLSTTQDDALIPQRRPSPDVIAAKVAELADMYLEQAYLTKACNALISFCNVHGLVPSELSAQFAAHGVDLQRMWGAAEGIHRGISECDDDAGWTLVRDDTLRVLYKHDGAIHSFKAACEIDAPVEQPLCLAAEFDLLSSWCTHIQQSAVLQQASLVELLVYVALWVPWPFAARDLVLQAVGADMLAERGCIAISFQSATALPPGCQEPPEAADRVRLEVLPGSCMKLIPLPPSRPGGPPRTRVSVVAHIDPKVPSVPDVLITFILRVFAPLMHKQAVKMIRTTFARSTNPLPMRMQQRPKLYNMVRERVQRLLQGTAVM